MYAYSAKPTAETSSERQIRVLEDANAEDIAEACRLYSWGRQAKDGRHYPGLAGVRHDCVFAAKGSWERDLRRFVPEMSDEEFVRVDAAISRLSPSQKLVVCAIYRDWIPWRKLPRHLHTSLHNVRKWQFSALGALEQILLSKNC